MIRTSLPIYLASKSPRRRKLLKLLNVDFKCITVESDESFIDGEHPVKSAQRIALDKLELAKKEIPCGIIITADTIVVLKQHVLGKPKNKKDAERILNLLSGNTHIVYTGFALYNTSSKITISGYEKTLVKFRDLGKKEIMEYIESGSPMDKAGAYGIQDDYGAVFVEKITGCYYNVVGLPLTKIYIALQEII